MSSYQYRNKQYTIDQSSYDKASKDYAKLKFEKKKVWIGLEVVEGNKLQLKAKEVGFWEKIQKFFGCGGWDYKEVEKLLSSKEFKEIAPIEKEGEKVHTTVLPILQGKEAASPFSEVSFDGWEREKKTADIVRLQFPSSETFLTLAKGDVTKNHGVDVKAVMNAANSTMYYGGGGTNAAFSRIIPEDHWKKYAKPLKVGDCAAMEWPEKPSREEKGQIKPQYLFHVLGPVVTDPKKLDQYQNEVYMGFKNLFADCKKDGLESVQITGLSTGIFCKGLPDKERGEWLEKADRAMFRAMKEAAADGSIKEIVLVDYQELPLSHHL